MRAEMIVLRLIHILGGVFWIGTVMFTSYFLMPVLAGAGPSAGAIMAGLRQRKFLVIIPIVAVLTMLSGLRMLWITSGGSIGAYAKTPVGRTFTYAGAIAIIGFMVGMAFARPAAMKAAALAAELGSTTDEAARARLTAELKATQRRGNSVSAITTILLLLAVGGMATARYMG